MDDKLRPEIAVDEVRVLLREMSSILSRYRLTERATYVGLVAEMYDTLLWQEVRGLEFWGGSGAVWEAAPFKYGHPEMTSAVSDYRRFQEIVIAVAESIEKVWHDRVGIETADLFKRLLASS